MLFANGTLAMVINGDWKIPTMTAAIGDRFKWSVTFPPRDKTTAADVGGSCCTARNIVSYTKSEI